MAEKRMVSSVYITLTPPWRGAPSVKEGTEREREARRQEPYESLRLEAADKVSSSSQNGLDEECTSPGHGMNTVETWPEYFDFSNGEILSFPHPILDDFSPVEDLLSPDVPPPPPPVPPPLPQLILVDLPPPVSGQPPSPGLRKLKPALSLNHQQVSSTFSMASKPEKSHPTNFRQVDQSQAPKATQKEQVAVESSAGICAFCHKTIELRVGAIEAMRKQYHVDCFTCRTCSRQLAGQLYYQKDGQPICDPCYKATLEKCARCQEAILEKIVRALGSGYHPACFTCVVCQRRIADESFAVDEQNEVYCADDYYRKFASVCSVCHDPIIPMNGKDSYKVECLGRSFHENCYRCEKCKIPLSIEPTEKGCYPLHNCILCKSCHVACNTESSC